MEAGLRSRDNALKALPLIKESINLLDKKKDIINLEIKGLKPLEGYDVVTESQKISMIFWGLIRVVTKKKKRDMKNCMNKWTVDGMKWIDMENLDIPD